MKLINSAILSTLLLSGCVTLINIRNAEEHTHAGLIAERRGDWYEARRQFAQAVINANLGEANLHGKAIVNYEYGRALGVTCSYEQSEKYLLLSKEFAGQDGQKMYLPVLELAILSQRIGDVDKANNYFSELIPLIKSAGLESTFPLGVADVYDRYADTLQAVGRNSDANGYRDMANNIRAGNLNLQRKFEFTPYGTDCKNE